MQDTGEWALRGLALVLLASPLARVGWRGVFRYRRILGVSVFLYVSVHLLLFAQVYVGWSGALLIEELKERPYVLVGFSAWVSLLPLALTSTDSARRRLGRRWRAAAPVDLSSDAPRLAAPLMARAIRRRGGGGLRVDLCGLARMAPSPIPAAGALTVASACRFP